MSQTFDEPDASDIPEAMRKAAGEDGDDDSLSPFKTGLMQKWKTMLTNFGRSLDLCTHGHQTPPSLVVRARLDFAYTAALVVPSAYAPQHDLDEFEVYAPHRDLAPEEFESEWNDELYLMSPKCARAIV